MTPDLGEPLVMDAASWSFGIHRRTRDADPTTLVQQVGPWLHDHRGRTTLASVGVVAELALGLGASSPGTAGVLASVTASVAGPLPADGVMTSRCDFADADPATGTAVVGASVLDASGATVVRLTGRAATVDRPLSEPEAAILDAIDLRADAAEVPAGTALDALTPIETVRSMIGAPSRLGAYARHVGLSIDAVEHAGVTGRWTALPWTTNPVGGVQGGVLLGVMSTIAELGAEAMCDVAQMSRLADLHVDMLRSPSPEMGEMTFRTMTTRKGRRFGNLDVVLSDPDGRLVAQARASFLFTPAG